VIIRSRVWLLATGLAVLSAGGQINAQVKSRETVQAGWTPELVHTCLITPNVEQLVNFYEPVLALRAKRSGADYAEFQTAVGVLAIFSAAAQEKYIPGSAEGAANNGVVLEFRVTDVDKEYRRLQGLVKTWVKAPSTQPWGTRSIYFRDPDGNLVDFFAPAPRR
jgi:catechol 2,3-dioxygenase-like lactoylglutathione lyase family enzyme